MDWLILASFILQKKEPEKERFDEALQDLNARLAEDFWYLLPRMEFLLYHLELNSFYKKSKEHNYLDH